MLMLTEDAIQAVRGLVSSSPTVPDDAGLRIVGQREGEAEIGLQLELAEAPAEDDQVIEEEGARVFLEPEAVSGVFKAGVPVVPHARLAERMKVKA